MILKINFHIGIFLFIYYFSWRPSTRTQASRFWKKAAFIKLITTNIYSSICPTRSHWTNISCFRNSKRIWLSQVTTVQFSFTFTSSKKAAREKRMFVCITMSVELFNATAIQQWRRLDKSGSFVCLRTIIQHSLTVSNRKWTWRWMFAIVRSYTVISPHRSTLKTATWNNKQKKQNMQVFYWTSRRKSKHCLCGRWKTIDPKTVDGIYLKLFSWIRCRFGCPSGLSHSIQT